MGEKKKTKRHSLVNDEKTKDGARELAEKTDKKHKKKKKLDVDGGLEDKKSSSKKQKMDLKVQDVESNEKLTKTTSKKEKKRHDQDIKLLSLNSDETIASKKEKKKKKESSKIKDMKEEKKEHVIDKDGKTSKKIKKRRIDEEEGTGYPQTVNEEVNGIKKPKKKKKEQKEVKSFEEFLDNEEEKKSKKKKSKDKDISDSKEQNVSSESSKDGAVHQALLYLHTWKNSHSEWTFKKVRQVWLLKNMFDDSKIADEDFSILLEYLEGLQGVSRQTTMAHAESMINNESDDASQSAVKLERAKRLLQILA